MSFMVGPTEVLGVDKKVVLRWACNNKRKTGIDIVVSNMNEPVMGVEIALLSRNIKIEGDAGGTALQGGYFQVFHTPGTAQTIEGVEFTNIGQQQGKNRFLLHFLYSGDVPGTSIARNLIQNFNYCCVVIEGSYNMTVEANFAHNTAGHCYYIASDARGSSYEVSRC
ncbi:hypothetical protein ACHAW6_012934 [Cyclotella cf. meneghiniana]